MYDCCIPDRSIFIHLFKYYQIVHLRHKIRKDICEKSRVVLKVTNAFNYIAQAQRVENFKPEIPSNASNRLANLLTPSHAFIQNVNKLRKMEAKLMSFYKLFRRKTGNIIGMIHLKANPGMGKRALIQGVPYA